MKLEFLSILIFLSFSIQAQHCPWDCAGMILIKTDAATNNLDQIEVTLVEDSTWIFHGKGIVIDTIYGTASLMADTCRLKSHSEFMSYRTAKIQLYHGYAYDTVYGFSEGHFLIKFNLCKYRGKKLYLHFYDRHSRGLTDRYIRIPEANRISLHDVSTEINARQTKEILELIREKIMYIPCTAWTFYETECK